MLHTSYARCPRSRSEVVMVLMFVFAYISAVLYFRHTSICDPTSAFFDPDRGFTRHYSGVRQSQAERFIQESSLRRRQPVLSGKEPTVCVGVATVQREDVRYFRPAIGSLLEGLSLEERQELYLAALIGHSDPKQHSAYNETWLHSLFDIVLTYDKLPDQQRIHMAGLEKNDTHFLQKPLFDYVYLLEGCLNTSASYVMILEDDVIALDGWFHRMKAALHDWETRPDFSSSIYLRLFYTDKFLGWNSEQWPYYLFWSSLAELTLACALLFTRRFAPPVGRHINQRILFFSLFVCGPACICLFFAAGRLTVTPFPEGIHRMDGYGCCSQALVFPRAQVPDLIEYYGSITSGKIDSLTEEYANKRGLSRWALTPALFQHVGLKSATRKTGGGLELWNRPSTASIWNAQFELHDATALKNQHKSALQVYSGG